MHFSQPTLVSISNHGLSGSTYVILRDTFDICAGAEEAALARDHREDGVGVLIERAQRRNGVLD